MYRQYCLTLNVYVCDAGERTVDYRPIGYPVLCPLCEELAGCTTEEEEEEEAEGGHTISRFRRSV